MPAFICTACGSQYAPTDAPPPRCEICVEERQYVPVGGQSWSTLEKLADGRFNAYRQHEPGMIGIGTQPQFAIGQRAILIQTPHGNVLWDCISFLDTATVTLVNALGGIKAIAISHPHYYTTMSEWSRSAYSGGSPIRSLRPTIDSRSPASRVPSPADLKATASDHTLGPPSRPKRVLMR